MRKGQSPQYIVLGKVDRHMLKNETGHLSYNTHTAINSK